MADDQLASDQATEARKAARPALVILMGTSGCGKSTCGKQLAIRLGVSFIDGDDLHPEGNVVKMSRGEALTDQDREPWLEIIRKTAVEVTTEQAKDHDTSQDAAHRALVIVACSALKRSYRDVLRGQGKPDQHEGIETFFVYLHGPEELLKERLDQRLNHFMTVSMLESQLATLEIPGDDEPDAVTVELADEDGIPKHPAAVADSAEEAIIDLVDIKPLMPTETPVRPPPKQVHPLPSIKVIVSASASIGLLIEALSLLLEPSASLKTDLAPELQIKLHSDHPPPIKYYRDLLDLAATVVNGWPNAKKADFLSGHPRIGEVHGLSKFSANEQGTGTATPTPSHVLKRLAELNAHYEKRFPGLRFVTFVNGRTRDQIADELEGVLKQHPTPVLPGSAQWTAELDRGIRDVWLIAKARLIALKVK